MTVLNHSTFRVLVIHANPSRDLRTDQEMREFEVLGRKHPSVILDCIHSARLNDVRDALLRSSYDAIHLACHGSGGAIQLEDRTLAPHELVSVLRLSHKSPRLLVVLACESHDGLSVLADSAPFVITATGLVRDFQTEDFVRTFYDILFSTHHIVDSFHKAKLLLKESNVPRATFVLSRRGGPRNPAAYMVNISIPPHEYRLEIDVSLALTEIEVLGIDIDVLTFDLEHRIGVHRLIFGTPRENAVLPIGGEFFGEFSWTSIEDISCTHIIPIHPKAPEELVVIWYRLTLAYNDLASSPHRMMNWSDPKAETVLRRAIFQFDTALRQHFEALSDLLHRAERLKVGFARQHVAHVSDSGLNPVVSTPEIGSHLDHALDLLHHVVLSVQSRITSEPMS